MHIINKGAKHYPAKNSTIKTQISPLYLLEKKLLLLISFIFFFWGCRKSDDWAEYSRVKDISEDKLASAKSDGIITVQTGILPPVTQQRFIPNSGSSVTEFQIVPSQDIFVYELFFLAPYPLIQSISTAELGPAPNAGGTIDYQAGPLINAGKGFVLHTHVNYSNVDSSTSGATAQLSLTRIVYRTNDEVFHDFYPGNAGKTQVMCLVNDIPHITLQDPGSDTLKNGFKEVAALKLTGDTNWVLNALPLSLRSIFAATIPKCKLVVKSAGAKIATEDDPVRLQQYSSTQTVINFTGGFSHVAGETEILKIFAPVSGFDNFITTTMSPLSSFIWTDGSGVKLQGMKNARFYKEQTGQSNLQ